MRLNFHHEDGTSSTAGSAASLILDTNTFYREFTDTVIIPDALQALPDLQGSGDVRDLKQTAANNADDFFTRLAA